MDWEYFECENFTFSMFFEYICDNKEFVLKLNSQNLEKYKAIFYGQNFPEWRLDMLWEYIWGDIDYLTMFYVFKKNKVI